jgi:hypothetical protein
MEERRRILEQIEAGELSVEEGIRRLEALNGGPPEAETAIPAPPAQPPAWVQQLWHVVFWPGVALLVGGALLVASVYAWDVAVGWLACGWPLCALGVLLVILGWWMHESRWLALRVQQQDGRRVSLAIPLEPAAFALRVASPFVPQLRETGVDEILMSIAEEARAGRPLVVDVEDREDGEQVQIIVG